MPVVFAGGAGKIIALNDPAVQGIIPLVTVGKGNASVSSVTPINFQNQKSLITRVTVSQQTNHQFLHTLGGDIYIYVFGDRIGQMTISGLSAAVDCDNPDDNQHGFEKIMAWYNQYKLSAYAKPITVAIGNTTLIGFVAGLNGSVFDHRLFLMQFDLTLMLVPQKSTAAQLPTALPASIGTPA